MHNAAVSASLGSPVVFTDAVRVGATTSDRFTSLADAREHADSILVVEGLEHGYVLLTCPVGVITATDIAVALLAVDLHSVSFFLDGLEPYVLSLWLERHQGGRWIRSTARGRWGLNKTKPWLLSPWGWHQGATSPSAALRAEVDAVLMHGKPRISAAVLSSERNGRLASMKAARLADRNTESADFTRAQGWDFDVRPPTIGFDLSPEQAQAELSRRWLAEHT